MLKSRALRHVLFALAGLVMAFSAMAGEAEIKSAQKTIDSQLKAFQQDNGALAYSFAAPNITRMYPTPEAFIGMVTNGYPPVRKPQSFAFGKSQETGPTSVVQQVMIVGPDGKDYEAVYMLELQPDGVYRITSCSLRAAVSTSV
ncbi:hypothetical protein ASD44_05460 [Mesorhizobium sp. Root554]|uniref:DUF4864 domain-containing protein n=1 Tax=unclassified Mesorhizobium TaxID=325217 RepID=UPI0006F65FF7|nr:MULTISPECIES: DUF4864 domain-containing protein [unclassified Mesorhizobium]KQZ13582.1 hypothetical protein ASD27_05465 [Mesorhizobium sp. Root1471]KQZ36093.1 hypothetical protein ASD44_05460 [Mesorhizobium sp. Root554]